MRRTRVVTVGAGLLAGVVALAGCGTTSGTPSFVPPATVTPTAVQSSVSTPSTDQASTTPPVTTVAAPTVTVTAVPQPRRRTVTRVVQAPDETGGGGRAPSSSGQLGELYETSTAVDGGDFSDSGGVFFDAPSENIGCFLSDGGTVSCAIKHYDFPQPGPDCDDGVGATIDGYGNPSLTDCDGYFPIVGRATVLPYGDSLTEGDYACISESSGVSCLDTDTATGFTLSREAFSPVYS